MKNNLFKIAFVFLILSIICSIIGIILFVCHNKGNDKESSTDKIDKTMVKYECKRDRPNIKDTTAIEIYTFTYNLKEKTILSEDRMEMSFETIELYKKYIKDHYDNKESSSRQYDSKNKKIILDLSLDYIPILKSGESIDEYVKELNNIKFECVETE